MSRQEPGPQAELLDAALSMGARGWHVFPCLPGRKQPALAVNWQAIATTDPERIRAWWRRTAYNIGIACGPSGLVVLDLDVPGHGGGPAVAGAATGTGRLTDLCHQHGEPYLNDTLTVRTPSGGQHIFFRSPPDIRIPNSAGRLAPLIDVRGDGGYVVGFGSRTAQGPYAVTRSLPLAPLPMWLSELARHPTPVLAAALSRPVSNTPAYGEAALGYEADNVARAAEGTRNDTLFKAARSLGQLAAGGVLHPDDIRAALSAAGTSAGLDRAEISRTIESGLKSGALMPRRPDPAPHRQPEPATPSMRPGARGGHHPGARQAHPPKITEIDMPNG